MADKPTVRDRVRERVCPNCGGTPERSSPKGPPPIFCSKQCKRDMNNRLIVEGRAVIGLLKAWRIDRGTGEIATRAFAQAVEVLDLFNAQDKAARRPRADLYAATLLATGTRYFDRQRKPKNPKESGNG